MKIIKSISQMQNYIYSMRKRGKTIGFVPTMGALHQGHHSLIHCAKKDNDIVVVSIFVNPSQFGPHEDYQQYPRTFQNDRKLARLAQVEALFIPTVASIYPKGYQTYVEVDSLSRKLCGISRPGHFRGVATIVCKLLNIVEPDTAYFGKKDYQQGLLIKRMAEDLNIRVKIIMCPTVREADGLAMSSRNQYLTDARRKEAICLYEALCKAKYLIISKRIRNSKTIINEMKKIIEKYSSSHIDYIKICDPKRLEDIVNIEGSILVALAVNIGKIRLIDNMIVNPKK